MEIKDQLLTQKEEELQWVHKVLLTKNEEISGLH